jgi:type VI secretion system secreted protein VgrG
VFWQVGSSATLGTGTRFVGTIMAAGNITANTAATIHGRLLAQTEAVNMDTNTITTSNCASSVTGSGGGTETTTPAEATALAAATALAETTAAGTTPAPGGKAGATPPAKPKTTAKRRHRPARHHGSRRAAKRRPLARPPLPHRRGSFTG